MDKKTLISLVDEHNRHATRVNNILTADKTRVTYAFLMGFLHPVRNDIASDMNDIIALLDYYDIKYQCNYTDYIITLL